MSRTVYIETTVVSYFAARISRDLVRAAQQQCTRDWWESQSRKFELTTSELVIIECMAGDSLAASERLKVLTELPRLKVTEAATQVADLLVAQGAIPRSASRDALHVGICVTNGIDFLLTWNFRHLANASLRDRIAEVCESCGYRPVVICTPEELFEDTI